jgi:hypothetical protein
MSKHKQKQDVINEEIVEDWMKRVQEDKKQQQRQRDEEEHRKYGVVTYERRPENTPKVTVIPVEIEVPWALDQLTKHEILDEIGYEYRDWIQECYLHRMRGILTDPTEFGKLVLGAKKRAHCLEDRELEDC